MATAPNVPNFAQFNFVIGDTTQVVTKQNGLNAALAQFGSSLETMTQSINTDLQTMEQQKSATQQAAQAASEDAQQTELDRQAVTSDRQAATTAAQSAGEDAQQTAQDRQAVAADRQSVASDRQAVESAAQSASADAAAAQQAKTDAESLYGDLQAVETAKTAATQAASDAGQSQQAAEQAKATAESAAATATSNAQQTTLDQQSVADDRLAVEQAAQSVTGSAEQVAIDAQQVAEDRASVTSSAQSVSENATTAQQAASAATTAQQGAETAQSAAEQAAQQAAGIIDDDVVDVGKTWSSQKIQEEVNAAGIPDAPADGKIYARQNGGWIAPNAFPENTVIGVALRVTGGPGGTFDHIDINGNTIQTPTASYFNYHPVFGSIQDVIVDGQHMVEVPKFYVKRGTAGGDAAWWISDQPLAGYEVHPAFLLDGAEVPAFQYGKYQASESGGKLQSIPGVLPKVSTSLTDFLALATARNVGGVEGFRLHHYVMWTATQWLYLVEMATMDSQTATGQGRVSESSAANVDAADVAQATYRGIVGLWGNVYQWMDGVRTLNDVIERRDYTGTWQSTGESVPNGGNATYPITFRESAPLEFIPNTYSTANDATATMPDYVRWRNGGEYYPYVGGYWSGGAIAGLWYVLCGSSASSTIGFIGARLSRIVS